MKETIKENPLLFLVLIITVGFIIWAVVTGLTTKDAKEWFNSPLSKLTKGDIIIFILCFGLWTRNSSK